MNHNSTYLDVTEFDFSSIPNNSIVWVKNNNHRVILSKVIKTDNDIYLAIASPYSESGQNIKYMEAGDYEIYSEPVTPPTIDLDLGESEFLNELQTKVNKSIIEHSSDSSEKHFTFNGDIIENGSEIIVVEKQLYYSSPNQKRFKSFTTIVSDLPEIYQLMPHEIGTDGRIYNPLVIKDGYQILYKINSDYSIEITFNQYNKFEGIHKFVSGVEVFIFLKTKNGLRKLKELTSELYNDDKNVNRDLKSQISLLNSKFSEKSLRYWISELDSSRPVMFLEPTYNNYKNVNYFLALKEILKDKPHLPDSKQRKILRREASQRGR